MGCKLSIGIKGDNNSNQRPQAKVSPLITHEQSTSPIRISSKTGISTQTSPVQSKSVEIQKDYAEKRTDYIPPDAEDKDNGTESKHSDSKNRWKSKARAIGAITGGSSVKHISR